MVRTPHPPGDFEPMYEGTPPWDIGRPQPAIVQLAQAGQIHGDVLDVGCGTGENALHVAARGHMTWGVDIAGNAIAQAKEKAKQRGVMCTFRVHDALALPQLRQRFDTIIDSGLFHVFSDESRPIFLRSVAAALKPGGRYHMLCFSEREPGDWGPRRVTQEEIRDAARDIFHVDVIEPAAFETNLAQDPIKGWRASMTRL